MIKLKEIRGEASLVIEFDSVSEFNECNYLERQPKEGASDCYDDAFRDLNLKKVDLPCSTVVVDTPLQGNYYKVKVSGGDISIARITSKDLLSTLWSDEIYQAV